MSKPTKKTPVLPPASKAKSQLANILQRAQLSQEFVVSDDESSNEMPTISGTSDKSGRLKKQKTTIGIHKPQTNGVAKKSLKHTPIPPPTTKKPSVELREIASSDSDESDTDEAKGRENHVDREERKAQEEVVGSSGSSSDSLSKSSDDDDDDDDEATPAHPPVSRIEPPRATSSQTIQSRPVQAYVPPKGFSAVPTPLDTASAASRLFSNTDSKQIWHITAPAGVSIGDIKQLAMEKILNGGAVVEHKGNGYGFAVEENERAARKLLLPRLKGLKAFGRDISRTLHLRRVVRLPNLSSEQADPNTGSEAAASIGRSAVRTPRPQLKGLRMHFRLSGFGDEDGGTLGSSDGEDKLAPQPSTAGLGVPKGAEATKKPKKRKHEHSNAEERSESPVKKHKQHSTPEKGTARAGPSTEKAQKHRTPEERAARAARKERKRQKELARSKQ